MIVLDTNVLSELMRHTPDHRVVAWTRSRSRRELYVSVITEAEILYGIEVLPPGKRRMRLFEIVRAIFQEEFAGRVLPLDSRVAACYAELTASRRRAGKPIEGFDALIAATALAAGAAIATRDSGFSDCGLTLFDPWAFR